MAVAVLFAVAATWQLRQSREIGGPLVESATGSQLETGIASCSPVRDALEQSVYVGFIALAQEHAPIPEVTIERIEYEVSDEVTRHRPVYASGPAGLPAGYLMAVGPDSWDGDGGFVFSDLPAEPGSDAGLGVVIEVPIDGKANPDEPVINITGVEYVDQEGGSYFQPLDRTHWISRRDLGDESYCEAADL